MRLCHGGAFYYANYKVEQETPNSIIEKTAQLFREQQSVIAKCQPTTIAESGKAEMMFTQCVANDLA